MVRCNHVISPTLLKTTVCPHSFFFHSITASDGSEGTTAGRVVSPRSIMVHHGLRSKEVRCARKQNNDYAKQHHTPHCWLPTKVIYPANTSPIFIVVKRSNINILILQYKICHMLCAAESTAFIEVTHGKTAIQ